MVNYRVEGYIIRINQKEKKFKFKTNKPVNNGFMESFKKKHKIDINCLTVVWETDKLNKIYFFIGEVLSFSIPRVHKSKQIKRDIAKSYETKKRQGKKDEASILVIALIAIVNNADKIWEFIEKVISSFKGIFS